MMVPRSPAFSSVAAGNAAATSRSVTGDPSVDRWTFFAGLWGVALLMHQATFDRWRYSPLGWALCALGTALVLRPASLPLLAVTVAVNAAYAVQCLPETANHLLFEGIVCATWAAAWLLHALRRARSGRRPVDWLRRDAGAPHPLEATLVPLRVGFVLVYWLSVLHKLNYDFIAPESSCASYMYRRVGELLPFLPRARWAEHTAIWGTLLAEMLVPALLLHPKTWRAGLCAALSFHLMLGLDPTPGIFSFTGLLYALFVLMLPNDFIATAAAELARFRERLGTNLLSRARLALAAAAVAILAYGATRDDRWSFRAGFVFFLLWSALVIVGYAVVWAKTPHSDAAGQSSPARAATAPWAWALPCIVLFNGINPYLGLRTQLSFSMFSNLRTEGGQSNHLFMPRLLSLGDYQEDLVEVLSSSDAEIAELAERELLIPFFEFRRLVSGADDLRVTYKRGGREQTFECVRGACNDRELAEPYSRLAGRLLYFRPVDKGPRMACRH